jgi:DNA repair protein RecO (recombination protein O)
MPRPRIYRVEAIVLRRIDFGEADRVIVLFTRQRGKMPVVAKGVRRISSRMAGHLELFTQSELQLARGQNLDVVTQAETRNPFRALREDLTRTSTAYLVTELADALTEEGVEQPEVYELMTATFEALGTTDDPRLVAVHYQLRLLDVTGSGRCCSGASSVTATCSRGGTRSARSSAARSARTAPRPSRAPALSTQTP